ncbi:MAG: aminodeoxychorismate synthase component I [Bdellovibrionales bacterium]
MNVVRSLAYRDPFAIFRALAHDESAALFEHMGRTQDGRRCVMIAANPADILCCHDLNAHNSFLERLRPLFTKEGAQGDLIWPGGVIGYFGYELAHEIERLPKPKIDAHASFPLAFLGVYEAVALYDTEKLQAWVVGSGPRAEERVEELAARLSCAPPHMLPNIGGGLLVSRHGAPAFNPWEREISRGEFERAIGRVIDYIYSGDIFQANLSQRFLAQRPRGVSDYDLFLRLRARSPAPYSAFLRCGDVSLASASPELFLRVDARGHVESQPIKGTRPRGTGRAEDMALADALRSSAKDHAENLMIVDVMRNDLARACRVGSVRVPRLCELETFPSVHHLVSHVEGDLSAGLSPVDLLRASFPGASISGAPKIRAMEIIHELESAPRGPYCGCFGWIGFNGAMELAMTIRTLAIQRDTVIAQAGGGIVADSVPADEYDETLVKAAPLLDTLV